MITFIATNDDDREWTVRVIERGERYGLDGALANDSEDPLVEFLDLSFPDFPAGFLVQRYRLSTLWSAHGRGVSFSAEDPEWAIDAETLHYVLHRIDHERASR